MKIFEHERWGKNISRRTIEVEGQKIGDVEVVINPRKGTASICRIELNAKRGEGYGKQAYIQIGNELAAEGLVLVSDANKTDDANHVWDSLVRNGYAEIVKDEKDAAGNKVYKWKTT